MLLWMGNLDLKICDILNVDPDHFFGNSDIIAIGARKQD